MDQRKEVLKKIEKKADSVHVKEEDKSRPDERQTFSTRKELEPNPVRTVPNKNEAILLLPRSSLWKLF